jgi:hypothetical protein
MTRNTNLDQGHDYNQDRDRNDTPANDNGRTVAATPAGGAMTSLAALATALSNVDDGWRFGEAIAAIQEQRERRHFYVWPKAHNPRRGQPLGRQSGHLQMGTRVLR